MTTTEPRPDSTIAPYYSDLNGVDLATNRICTDVLWSSLGLVVLIILCLRVSETIWNRIRLTAVLSDPTGAQEAWRSPRTSWTAKAKKHLIYASAWTKRHHREYRFLRLNFGTLPSRLHIISISIYVLSNAAYLAIINYHTPNRYAVYAQLRGRSGALCVANMVPLVILAGRNNPLINLLKISFDTFNYFHRWIGRIIVAELVIHVACWLVPVIADGGLELVGSKIRGDLFLSAGLTGVLCMVLIVIMSLSPIRHAFYETFLALHILLAIVAFICTWIHCTTGEYSSGGLPQLPSIMAVVCLWVSERMIRVARTVYMNWSSKGLTRAICEAMPGDVTRVTLHLPRNVRIKPGSHAYLRFWGVHPWESHPFSIAWVDYHSDSSIPGSTIKLPASKAAQANATTTASFIINAHSGMTRKLLSMASKSASGMQIKATMEGPYAGYHVFDSYGHLVLIAGAGGITHQISYLRPLLESFNAGTVATRRLTLIWVIRDCSWISWVSPHLDYLRNVPRGEDFLNIKVFITRPPIQNNSFDPDHRITILTGRPDFTILLAEEISVQIGAMSVSVCGPGSLTDDVRDAVRAIQGNTIVDFVEESFTW